VIAVADWLSNTDDLPRLERELLLSDALALSRAQIIAGPEREIPASTLSELDADAERLRRGEPLAYIVGYREFWGLAFKVSPAVLIPRPETELLVELCMKLAPAHGRVLELGTGSGALAVAIAHERPDLKVTATDISQPALNVAMQNAAAHEVGIEFLHSDWFTGCDGVWDVIVSNPPYVATDDPHLCALHAEPRAALVSGDDGLHDLRHIVATAPGFLRAGGHLVLEHGYDQAQSVRALMRHTGYHAVNSAMDLACIERATVGCKASSVTG
jgi:release factor glutamine methyltransferase